MSLRLLVVDDCGTPLLSGGVFVRLSNDSRTISLTHVGNGNWSGTWVPANADASVGVVATAFSTGNSPLGGQTPILQGTVRSTNSALARATGIYNSASFKAGDQVALGSWASLFGEGLADGEALATGTPFGAQLGSTQVRLGGMPLPLLYVNPTQVNALIPRNLDPNTQQQIVVQRGVTISVPMQVTVADVQPGIYAVNQQGTGQGAVLIGNTVLLVAPAGPGARPAGRGETISIFCTGLGAVTSAPPDGVPAPLDSLVRTLATPTVTMGDAAAQVPFSGLAPGLAGVFQVNAVVPDTAPSGDAVPLIVTMNDVPSNTVTIAIR